MSEIKINTVGNTIHITIRPAEEKSAPIAPAALTAARERRQCLI